MFRINMYKGIVNMNPGNTIWKIMKLNIPSLALNLYFDNAKEIMADVIITHTVTVTDANKLIKNALINGLFILSALSSINLKWSKVNFVGRNLV